MRRRLLKEESGATVIEYALLLALVAVVVIVAVRSLGGSVNGVLTNSANQIAS